MPLSDTAIRNAKPLDKSYKLTDAQGLYLLIKPNGSNSGNSSTVLAVKRKSWRLVLTLLSHWRMPVSYVKKQRLPSALGEIRVRKNDRRNRRKKRQYF